MDVIKFVDSISATPTVRLDLNGASATAPLGTEDFEDTTYIFGITGTWARSNTRAQAGTWSMRSASIPNSGITDMQVVTAGAARIEFYYWTSTEAGFDFFQVLAGGTVLLQDSGVDTSWQFASINVPTGVDTLTFRYMKDSANVVGDDAVYIDQLTVYAASTWAVRYEGTDFSPPPLKQAWSNTLLVDGERLSAAAYANRQIHLSMDLMTSSQDENAAELQKLWRELNRPSNFLMYQPQGASQPVFFRTLRSSNTRVTDFPVGAIRQVDVTIDAEPFAYGLKEQQSTVTITNDPASGANPMYFDVASPKGDVETPLYMAVQGSAVVKAINAGDPPARPMSAIAVRRRGTPANSPFLLEGEALEPLSQTAAIRDTGSSTMSGSGSLSPIMNANPTFEVNVTNWTATSCTLTRDTTQFNSGVASMKMVCAGGVAQAVAESEKVAISQTKLYGATAWVRIAVARPVDVAINWYTSGDVYISTSTIARATVSTLNTWVAVEHLGLGKPPPTAAKASMTIALQGTPALNEAMFIDDAQLGLATHIRANNSDVTASMKSVAQMALYPVTPSVDARGTYRVFMRYRYVGGGSNDDIMVRLWWGNGVYNGNVVLKRPTTGLVYADLGLVNIPGGYDPVNDGVSGVEVAAEGVYLNLQIQDTPGFTSAAGLDVDHFLFFPADDRLLLALWQNRINAPAPTDVLLDSARGQVYSRNASGQPGMLTGHELAGGPPMVTPGVSNRVFFALDVGTELKAAPLAKGTTYTVAPHYWPRYLTVRPVSS